MLIAVIIAGGFFSCGVERQDLKVLRDPGFARLAAPRRLTIEQLAGAPRPYGSRGWARIERIVAVVDAAVVEVRDESDGDLHVVLMGKRGRTLVAEFPSPECTAGSSYASRMAKAREDFLRLASLFGRGRRSRLRLRFTGVVFFDRYHGQRYGALNGIELHPILAVEAIGGKGQPHVPKERNDDPGDD